MNDKGFNVELRDSDFKPVPIGPHYFFKEFSIFTEFLRFRKCEGSCERSESF